jgi:hypothetical protein
VAAVVKAEGEEAEDEVKGGTRLGKSRVDLSLLYEMYGAILLNSRLRTFVLVSVHPGRPSAVRQYAAGARCLSVQNQYHQVSP